MIIFIPQRSDAIHNNTINIKKNLVAAKLSQTSQVGSAAKYEYYHKYTAL